MCLAQVIVVLACQVSEALKLPEEGLQEFIKGSELTYFACPWSEMPAHERMISVVERHLKCSYHVEHHAVRMADVLP